MFYLALLSSYDLALADELKEIGHFFNHEHSSNKFSLNFSSDLNNYEDESLNNSKHSKSNCPESEGCHTLHQCHMGHCGYLPSAFIFVSLVLNSEFSPNYFQIFQSRPLGGLFKPPRLSKIFI